MNPSIDVAKINQLRDDGATWKEIGAELGQEPECVRTAYRRATGQLSTAPLKITPFNAQDEMYEPYNAALDDTPVFTRWLSCFKGRYLRVMLWPDGHIPDMNVQAANLGLSLARLVRAHVHAFIGDTFDLDLISSFGKSHRRKMRGAIGECGRHWTPVVDALHAIDKHAPIVAFGGNHDGDAKEGRMGRALSTPEIEPFADDLLESYVAMIRSRRRVLWLAHTQEIKIKGTVLQHGKRVGKNAAENALKDLGFGLNTVFGHGHFPRVFYLKQFVEGGDADYRLVASAMLPTLANLSAHYNEDTERTGWVNGCGVLHIDMQGWDCHIQPIVFHRTPQGELTAAYGNEIVSEPAYETDEQEQEDAA